MPLFFTHIRQGRQIIEDTEGEDCASLEEARGKALKAAWEIMSDRVARGEQPDDDELLIADETGQTLLVLPFRHALQPR